MPNSCKLNGGSRHGRFYVLACSSSKSYCRSAYFKLQIFFENGGSCCGTSTFLFFAGSNLDFYIEVTPWFAGVI